MVRKSDGLNKLDLHGARHYEVDYKVENFILMNQDLLPLTIVCGNSQRMIDLTRNVVDRIGCQEVDISRYGVIRILRL
jgi:hypothetical protein